MLDRDGYDPDRANVAVESIDSAADRASSRAANETAEAWRDCAHADLSVE